MTKQLIQNFGKDCHEIYKNAVENRLDDLRAEVSKNTDNDNMPKKHNP